MTELLPCCQKLRFVILRGWWIDCIGTNFLFNLGEVLELIIEKFCLVQYLEGLLTPPHCRWVGLDGL